MMRTILFRGKRIGNGEWVYGDLIHSRIACQMWINTHNIECAKHTFIQPIEVIPESVGQYTGLTDKNGAKVFEGDVLNENGYFFHVMWDSKWAKFKLQHDGHSIQYPEWNRGAQMSIVGNTTDNPKLLGGDGE